MKATQIILFVLLLIIPISASTIVVWTNDDQSCELLETLNEEEEEDDKNCKDFEESELFRNTHSTAASIYASKEFSQLNYSENHPVIHHITLEVQTPPPERAMC